MTHLGKPHHWGFAAACAWLAVAVPFSSAPAPAPIAAPQRSEIYPNPSWQPVAAGEESGWSSDKLAPAREYAKTIKTAAVMVIVGGRVLGEWGDTAKKFGVYSIRKQLLNALYGIAVGEGRVDVSKTMGQLDVDDNEPSLTAVEKTATLRQLLESRSGIYHTANYQSEAAKARRPVRGSHAPGTFWYYNNWDFNVLGIVFERSMKNSVFREFEARIAEPIGMEDFTLDDTEYVAGPESVYPAYTFRLTARDMARFGLLFLREGRWNARQIVPRDWVKESTRSYSDAGASGGFGYLWWVAVGGRHFPGVELPEGTFSARGSGGHIILIVPKYDLVIVHRVNTDIQGTQVTNAEFGRLVNLILDARVGR